RESGVDAAAAERKEEGQDRFPAARLGEQILSGRTVEQEGAGGRNPLKSQSLAQVASGPQEVTGQPRRVVVGGVTWRDTFAALKHRNFKLFFIGQLVSLIGSLMQNTAQGWLVYQLTGSKVLLGTVAAVGSLPMLLL